jgi:hypothetical protein
MRIDERRRDARKAPACGRPDHSSGWAVTTIGLAQHGAETELRVRRTENVLEPAIEYRGVHEAMFASVAALLRAFPTMVDFNFFRMGPAPPEMNRMDGFRQVLQYR